MRAPLAADTLLIVGPGRGGPGICGESLNILLTSHVWRQDHNGLSHQAAGFMDHVANKFGLHQALAGRIPASGGDRRRASDADGRLAVWLMPRSDAR
jgi:hypothetical protein